MGLEGKVEEEEGLARGVLAAMLQVPGVTQCRNRPALHIPQERDHMYVSLPSSFTTLFFTRGARRDSQRRHVG